MQILNKQVSKVIKDLEEAKTTVRVSGEGKRIQAVIDTLSTFAEELRISLDTLDDKAKQSKTIHRG
jgi:hypothetical protein